MREVSINGDRTLLVASPMTPWIYEREFAGGDMLGDLLKIRGGTAFNGIPKMAWAMARCAKYPAPFPDFESWIEGIGGWDFSDTALMGAVVLEASRGLFRGKAAVVSQLESRLGDLASEQQSEPGPAGDGAQSGTDLQ